MTNEPKEIKNPIKYTSPRWIIMIMLALGGIFMVLVLLTYLTDNSKNELLPYSIQSSLSADYGSEAAGEGQYGESVDIEGLPLVAQVIFDSGEMNLEPRLGTLASFMQTPVPTITPYLGTAEVIPPLAVTPTPGASLTLMSTATLDELVTASPLTPEASVTPSASTVTESAFEEPPGPVVLVSPEGPLTELPTMFTWQPAERAESYALSISGSEGQIHSTSLSAFDLGCAKHSDLCTYQIELPYEEDAVYQFHVIPANVLGYGPISPRGLFSIASGALALPEPVVVISPSEGEEIEASVPEFTWQPQTGVPWYQIMIWQGEDVVNQTWLSAVQICLEDFCSVELGYRFTTGAFAWSVLAYNASGSGPVGEKVAFSIQ
jgi:hypothetical protein